MIVIQRLLIPLVLFLSAMPLWSQTADRIQERRFIWNEANAGQAKSETEEDWMNAAADYQALVDLGARNGRLFYNLGTALLMAGKYQDAEAALRRAEIYEGREADIRHNLELAIRKQEKPSGDEWTRAVFFWHYDWPLKTRAALASSLFLVCWVLLMFRMFAAYREFKVLFPLAILLCIMLGSSYSSSLFIELGNKRPLSLNEFQPENDEAKETNQTIVEGASS